MDIIELLEEHDIRYWKSGKNVSKGWIGLQCKFCPDDSNHLGIRLKDLRCRCWKCGGHGLINTISHVLEVPFKEAKKICRDLDARPGARDVGPDQILDKQAADNGIVAVRLPAEATNRFPKVHKEYLRSRGFAPLRLIRQYRLKAVENIGRYKFRIIIPIIFEGRIISFTSRDVTGVSNIPYLAASEKKYPNPKHYIYNFDSIVKGGDCVLVEGPADVWKLGPGSASLLGVQHDEQQLIHLYRKGIRKLHILFDDDEAGHRAASSLSKILAPFVKEVNIVTLDIPGVKDPGELTVEESEIVMQTLGVQGFM